MSKHLILIVGTVVLLSACKRESLSSAGRTVHLLTSDPQGCTSLGLVVGRGGGTIKEHKMVEYATNDARNKAADLGATHLVMQTPQFGSFEGTTNNATVSGIAHRCPPRAQSAAPQTP